MGGILRVRTLSPCMLTCGTLLDAASIRRSTLRGMDVFITSVNMLYLVENCLNLTFTNVGPTLWKGVSSLILHPGQMWNQLPGNVSVWLDCHDQSLFEDWLSVSTKGTQLALRL